MQYNEVIQLLSFVSRFLSSGSKMNYKYWGTINWLTRLTKYNIKVRN
jgi:hypothetical protein